MTFFSFAPSTLFYCTHSFSNIFLPILDTRVNPQQKSHRSIYTLLCNTARSIDAWQHFPSLSFMVVKVLFDSIWSRQKGKKRCGNVFHQSALTGLSRLSGPRRTEVTTPLVHPSISLRRHLLLQSVSVVVWSVTVPLLGVRSHQLFLFLDPHKKKEKIKKRLLKQVCCKHAVGR